MRHEHVTGKSAIDGNSDGTRRVAQMFIATATQPASATTDPGIDGETLAYRDAGGLWTDRLDNARNFMAERKRQFPPSADIEPLVVSKFEATVLQMDI
jgi:hypothetical protein